jgi:hypothetical protein
MQWTMVHWTEYEAGNRVSRYTIKGLLNRVPRLHHPHPRRGSLLKHATALKDQIQTKTQQILLEYRLCSQSTNDSAEKILREFARTTAPTT